MKRTLGPIVPLEFLVELHVKEAIHKIRQSNFWQSQNLRGHHGVKEVWNLTAEVSTQGHDVVIRSMENLDYLGIRQQFQKGAQRYR